MSENGSLEQKIETTATQFFMAVTATLHPSPSMVGQG